MGHLRVGVVSSNYWSRSESSSSESMSGGSDSALNDGEIWVVLRAKGQVRTTPKVMVKIIFGTSYSLVHRMPIQIQMNDSISNFA